MPSKKGDLLLSRKVCREVGDIPRDSNIQCDGGHFRMRSEPLSNYERSREIVRELIGDSTATAVDLEIDAQQSRCILECETYTPSRIWQKDGGEFIELQHPKAFGFVFLLFLVCSHGFVGEASRPSPSSVEYVMLMNSPADRLKYKDDSAIPAIPKGNKGPEYGTETFQSIQHPFGPTSEDWANNWFSVLEYLHDGAYNAAQLLDKSFILDRVQIARFVGAFLDNVEHSVMSMIENTDKAWSLSKEDPRRAYTSLNRNEDGTLASWVSDGAIIRPKEDVFDIKKMWGITSVEILRRDRVEYLEIYGFIEYLNSFFNRVDKAMVTIFGVTGIHASAFMDYMHLCIARIKETVL